MKTITWFLITLSLLALLEVARVYFIMPFPGSQLDDAANLSRVELAYGLHRHIGWLRPLGWLVVALLLGRLLTRRGSNWHRWLAGGVLVAYGALVYGISEELMADRMFYQPRTKRMVPLSQNQVATDKLVLGVVENGEARAYPIQLIGYHHQVRDTVGGEPIMVTYCTVCRTGRVFSPVVEGKGDEFRLVGMDHFNAMFEDASTGSWWRQATGEAILGPRRGQTLRELTARHLTLAEWAEQYPQTLVLQPDPAFKAEIDSLATYDTGVRRGKLTGRDSASWQNKSWVVGVQVARAAKAYDWNELVRQGVINDAVGGQAVVLLLAPDQMSFGVWNRTVGDRTLTFKPASGGQFTDQETGTTWNRQGLAVKGPLAGQRLQAVRAYQEFWHSWRSFHPQTERKLGAIDTAAAADAR